MIQLIGFLMSIYVVARGLDIMSRVEDRKSDRSASLARVAAWMAIAAGVFFFILFIAQGNSMPSSANF